MRLLEDKSLSSKVARRVFTLFAISALLPIFSLAVLHHFQGAALLVDHTNDELRSASSHYGTLLQDRLGFAEKLLRDTAQNLNDGISVEQARKRVNGIFRNLILVTDTSALTDSETGSGLTFTLPDQTLKNALIGDLTLLTRTAPDNPRTVLIIRALDPARPDRGLLVAEIDGNFLWNLRGQRVSRTDLCILDYDYVILNCSEPLHFPNVRNILGVKARTALGSQQWKTDGEKYVGYFHDLSVAGEQPEPRWIVVATQRKTDALAALNRLNAQSVGSIGVFALLAVLLSITQIRRTLAPLKELIDGTKRLRNKEFSARVEIDSEDEFGTLATSFNIMARRLGRQFDVMTTLSAIDRAILLDLEVDRVMEEVLVSLRKIYQARCAGIAVTDRKLPDQMQLYTVGDNPNCPMVKRVHIGEASRTILLASPDDSWTGIENAASSLMSQQHGWDARHTFNFKIPSKSGIGGLLLLGFPERVKFEKDDIENIQDFTDRIGVALSSIARDQQLYKQARYDDLTELPNRFLLVERLKQEISLAQRESKQFAVLYIDLDRFKQVNDSFGHAAGDQLLMEAAQRLRGCVRESDTVARVGGDEFTVILSGFGDAQVAGIVADHILTEMDKPFLVSGTENFVSASIGVVVYPQDGTTPNELLNNADTAMYRSKASGRSMCVFFEESMNEEAVRIATLDRDLRHAISEDQLILHYQPQIDLSTGSICAVEALVRWQHPERGLLSPETFVEFAEDSGLIIAVGEYVLREACRQFCVWHAGGIHLGRVSVNVSGKQFRQLDFVKSVEQTITESGIKPNQLALELTENILLHDVDQVSETLQRLKLHGIRIELDDFGTGYSSMSYLEKLPVDALKIDRAFVRTIDSAGRGGVIAKLVLDMARALNMGVIAEGIQSPEHLDFMRANNCDIGQGFLFCKPLPAEDISTFYANWNLVMRSTMFPVSREFGRAMGL